MSAHLIALDWGSTNCRVALIDRAGGVMECYDGGSGVTGRDHRSLVLQLREIVLPLRAKAGEIPVLLSGMIGSRHGLAEARYCECPAGLATLAANLQALDSAILPRCWLVPGLRGATPRGDPDVMRGEEVQIFGWLAMTDRSNATGLMILPGTHSKWVEIDGGHVSRFATALSGELFALLSAHGSLASLIGSRDEDDFDYGAFHDEIESASPRHHLTHALFTLRARALTGGLPTSELRSRLSALLVAHEAEGMLEMFRAPLQTVLVGAAELSRLYQSALAAKGVAAIGADGDEQSAAGAFAIARCAGLIGGE